MSKQRGRHVENITPIIKYPQYYKADKLVDELEALNKKYLPKKGDRKPRILKVDKERIEAIEKELEEFQYGIFPEDAPIIKVRKNGKTAQTKI
jgi:hypothetical protein